MKKRTQNTFPPKRKHVRGPIRLAIMYRKTLVKNAKIDVRKPKTANFIFIQLTNGAVCILHVTKLVFLVPWDQHIRN